VGLSPVDLTFIAGGSGIAIGNSARWVTPDVNSTVMIVNTAKALAGAPDAVTSQIDVGEFPRALVTDGVDLFVSNFNSQTISGISLAQITP
jgi:hypothetical protein